MTTRPKYRAEKLELSVTIKIGQMIKSASRYAAEKRGLGLARVLIVHADLAPRLALQTILQAGGYFVDAAATSSEALAKLDENQYDLVLSDEGTDSATSRNLLAYARVKEYHPATALITGIQPEIKPRSGKGGHELSIHTENLPVLLGKVADLIGVRAIRRNRPLRQAV